MTGRAPPVTEVIVDEVAQCIEDFGLADTTGAVNDLVNGLRHGVWLVMAVQFVPSP